MQRISTECTVRNATSHLPSPKAEKQVAKRRWDNYKNQKACRAGIKQCLQGTADSGTDEFIEKKPIQGEASQHFITEGDEFLNLSL